MPNQATWTAGWWVLDHRFWWTTGITDYEQGLAVGWQWSDPLYWALHCGRALVAHRLLEVRRWLAWVLLVWIPILVGPSLVLVQYYGRWL